jgi:hypothetical protein
LLVLLPVLASILAAGILATGIGLTGPDQIFQITQGGSLRSHAWLWNEGSSAEDFRVSVEGDISGILTASPIQLTIPAGGSSLITLGYRVPADLATGTHTGELRVIGGDQIATSIARNVAITVTPGSEEDGLQLRTGLNLVGWLGRDCTLAEGLGQGTGPRKVWRRNPDGTYAQAEYYEAAGVWWSADSTFSGLRYGEAYFVECGSDCVLAYQEYSGPKDIYLLPGTNLIVWRAQTLPFSTAFPQDGDTYSVTKVWHRTPVGEYESAQYYPSVEVWWSQNPDFSALVKGGAYFVESISETHVQP